jgi:hypothetical protein
MESKYKKLLNFARCCWLNSLAGNETGREVSRSVHEVALRIRRRETARNTRNAPQETFQRIFVAMSSLLVTQRWIANSRIWRKWWTRQFMAMYFLNWLSVLIERTFDTYVNQSSIGQYNPKYYKAGLSNAAPVIYTYFPGALIYSAGFNINQNFKKKIFLNNSMFQFFS